MSDDAKVGMSPMAIFSDCGPNDHFDWVCECGQKNHRCLKVSSDLTCIKCGRLEPDSERAAQAIRKAFEPFKASEE